MEFPRRAEAPGAQPSQGFESDESRMEPGPAGQKPQVQATGRKGSRKVGVRNFV